MLIDHLVRSAGRMSQGHPFLQAVDSPIGELRGRRGRQVDGKFTRLEV